MKAIETIYNGYRFRSRLEARWAVFFDEMGIKYEYEPQGYRLDDGKCYLPDFYLPDLSYFVEVKGKNDHLAEDINRISEFVREYKTAIIVLSQIPYDKEAKGLYWFPVIWYSAQYSRWGYGRHACFMVSDDCKGYIGDDFAVGREKRWQFEFESYHRTSDWIYEEIQAISGADLEDYDEEDETYALKDCYDFSLVEKALLKARQARFEHGEKP